MPVVSADSPAEPSVCAGCGSRIADRYYLLAVDRQWHSQCLKCCECKLRLDSELTCFARDGNIYCKEDYYRLFAVKRCARCHLGISASELVMRARDLVYHVHCFTCASCNKPLTKGDQFGMKDSMVYCRLHYEALLQGEAGLTDLTNGYSTSPTRLPYYNGVGAVQKGRPRKRKSPEQEAHTIAALTPPMELMPTGNELCNLDQGGGYDHTTPPPNSTNPLQPTRTKRMRTSFKHHQLRTMKSYFALNQNPDAKDLKQLAQKTGLSKRVLQVWFQNARAKWRRNMMRQDSQGSDKPSDSSIADLGSSAGLGDPLGGTPALTELPPTHLNTSDEHGSPPLSFGDLY